jgi:hypothetical protein
MIRRNCSAQAIVTGWGGQPLDERSERMFTQAASSPSLEGRAG